MKQIKVTPTQKLNIAKELSKLTEMLNQSLQQKTNARSEGDLSENSAYDDAVRACDDLGKQIVKTQQLYDNAIVVTDIDTTCVNILTKVRVLDLIDNTEAEYTIVDVGQGSLPANVSVNSKFGEAILKKPVGAVFEYYDTLLRHHKYRILNIREAD